MPRARRPDERGPWGDASRHLSFDAIARGLTALHPPPDAGRIDLIVARCVGEGRETPERVALTPEGGVPGDAWGRVHPDRIDMQVAVMRSDFARLVANGQPLTLFGDNLLVDLDLSAGNLPVGSRLRAGGAELEVTPFPHNGCAKFRQRFGADALRLTADARHRTLRLRGVYLKVVAPGDVAVGDTIEVVHRADRAPSQG